MLSAERILLTTDAVGGVWRYSMELAEGLRALGLSVRVVSLGPPPSPEQRAEAGDELIVTDLPLDWLAKSDSEIIDAAVSLAAMARDWGADGVHLHTPALASAARWPCPVVAVAHSCVGTWWRAVKGSAPLPPDLAWRSALVGDGLRAADVIITPSRSFAHALSGWYRLERPVHAVANGRRPLPVPVLPRAGILTAGRLWDEAKNAATLDVAAARIATPIHAAGPVRDPTGACIGLQHVQPLGTLDEAALARAYARAAVFVSVARYEPFGLAVLEAAQAGCALVLSDIPTFRELWDGAARFVPPDDPDAIAQAIETALHAHEADGAAARARARRYTREAMTVATLALHPAREYA